MGYSLVETTTLQAGPPQFRTVQLLAWLHMQVCKNCHQCFSSLPSYCNIILSPSPCPNCEHGVLRSGIFPTLPQEDALLCVQGHYDFLRHYTSWSAHGSSQHRFGQFGHSCPSNFQFLLQKRTESFVCSHRIRICFPLVHYPSYLLRGGQYSTPEVLSEHLQRD